MIVSTCKIGITEKNYAPNVMKNTIRMRKNEIVFIGKSPKRGRQNIGGIIPTFSTTPTAPQAELLEKAYKANLLILIILWPH